MEMKSYIFNDSKDLRKDIDLQKEEMIQSENEVYQELYSKVKKLVEDNKKYLKIIEELKIKINKLESEKYELEKRFRPFIVPITIKKDQVEKVKKLLELDKKTIREIAEITGVSSSTVTRIKQGRYDNMFKGEEEVCL